MSENTEEICLMCGQEALLDGASAYIHCEEVDLAYSCPDCFTEWGYRITFADIRELGARYGFA